MMNHQSQTLGVLVVAIAGLAFLDGSGESDTLYGLIGAGLGVIPPAASAYITVYRSNRNGNSTSASYWGAIIVDIIGVVVYGGYLLTGPSSPDTAGHMHIVLFPIVYAIIAFLVFIPCLLIDLSRSKKLSA
jgi:hypothetical protein